MAAFTYPTSAELNEIAQTLMPRLMEGRVGFRLMPMRNVDAPYVIWEQKDNYTGLQQLRGLNGGPQAVQHVGLGRYQMEPGYYGEFKPLDEAMLTLRRQIGTFATPINVADLVSEAQEHLLQRRLDRIEWIIWTLLTTGTFSVTGPNGITHSDTYTQQTYNATTWGTAATATPLADFRAVQLLGRGISANFGASALAYMNRVSCNALLANTNAADIYGKRTAGLQTANDLDRMNSILMGEDLPTIEVYDQGYLDSSGTFQPYIANGVVLVVGQRPAGQTIGEFQMTRNMATSNMSPGAYMQVVNLNESNGHIPQQIQVHDGFNGGPALWFPSATVRMDIS